MSQDSARIALAARIHVSLRRKTGRVTDTEWMASDPGYANEVMRLCRATEDAELAMLADKLELAMHASRPRPAVAVAASSSGYVASVPSGWHPGLAAVPDANRERERKVEQRYIGRLR